MTAAISFNTHVVLVSCLCVPQLSTMRTTFFINKNLGVSEEVLGSGSALWFSPEGNRLAFAQFNDTDVDSFTYFKYGEPGSLDSQYPEAVVLKYPKVISGIV